MIELAVEECREHVSRWPTRNERNRRKALSGLCADCKAVANVETAPTGILERVIRDTLGGCPQPRRFGGCRRNRARPRWRCASGESESPTQDERGTCATKTL